VVTFWVMSQFLHLQGVVQTFVIQLLFLGLSGIYLRIFQMDPCHRHAGMTQGGWIPVNDLLKIHRQIHRTFIDRQMFVSGHSYSSVFSSPL
jgi:hypothetical protein